MHKFFTDESNINDNYAKIVGDDVKHIYKVLRLDEGEDIILNDMKGSEYIATISEITKAQVSLKIKEKLAINNESEAQIYLFQGMPKSQKMDLIVQKCTELGVKEITPVITERVDVKLKGEFKKIDRLSKIALEAAKQSKRSLIPSINTPIMFDKISDKMKDMDLFIVPYENAKNFGVKSLVNSLEDVKSIKKIGMLVGPEGGFEEYEIENLKKGGAKIVTLGKRILRTETAGFVLASLLQYEFGDLGGI